MIVVIITIISTLAYTEFKEAIIDNLDDKLRSDVGAAIVLLSNGTSEAEIQKTIKSILGNKTDTHRLAYGVWLDDQRDYIASSESFKDVISVLTSKLNKESNKENLNFYNIEYQGKTCRAAWGNYTKTLDVFPKANNLNIVVLVSSHYAWHEIGEFVRALLITGVIAVWLTAGLVMCILRLGLKPIQLVANEMADTSVGNLFRLKFKETESPEEIKPFAIAWNQLIAKLSKTMSQQKQFTADASHELRTPLAVIKSSLQISRFQKRSTESYEKTIDQCLKETQRMEKLIDQLLELARFDEDISCESWQKTDLQDLLVNICEKYTEVAKQKKQTINIKDILSIAIIANPNQLTRAFSNLIENAVKYAPENSEITIEMHRENSNIEIIFHDEGGGIPANECESIFDRFYRADKARSHKSGGAGLGLAITKEIIERHNGSISVKSTPQDGTIFTVKFPILKSNY